TRCSATSPATRSTRSVAPARAASSPPAAPARRTASPAASGARRSPSRRRRRRRQGGQLRTPPLRPLRLVALAARRSTSPVVCATVEENLLLPREAGEGDRPPRGGRRRGWVAEAPTRYPSHPASNGKRDAHSACRRGSASTRRTTALIF